MSQTVSARFAAMLADLIATRDSVIHPTTNDTVAARYEHFGGVNHTADRTHGEARSQAAVAARTAPRALPEPRSLFAEILEFMLAPLLLLWPLTIVVTLLVGRSLADEPYDQALRDRALLLSEQLRFDRASDLGVRSSVPSSAHDLLLHDGAKLRYQVVGPDDRTIFGDDRLPLPSLYDFPELGQVKFRSVTLDNAELRVAYIYVPVLGEENLSRPVLVQVSETLDARKQLASRIIKGVIFPQFVILPLAAALVWFGLSQGLRPLRGLRDRIRNRRPDDLSPIDPRSAPHEIVPLVESFNELLVQLGATMTTQRRFIADAAHQIKTPLAGITMQAELALRATDELERRRSLAQLARSSERASHLMNQLLALARAESTGEATPLERVDLDALTREVLADLAPLAVAEHIDFGFDGNGQPLIIEGNRVLLGELLQNLVVNAIYYTPAQGLINIRLNRDGPDARIEIEDNGPGIPEIEREVIFERFYRLRDRPATTEAAARGSGLGLAIVREIARLHGGRIVIKDGAPWPASRGVGLGTNFVVRLPIREGRAAGPGGSPHRIDGA